ncbi:MAG: type II secretion system F family protein [Planctomycetota bacterium]
MNVEMNPSGAGAEAEASSPTPRFAYVVQVGGDGGAAAPSLHMEGTLRAANAEAARATLTAAGLSVLSLERLEGEGGEAVSDRSRHRRLGALDFAAFNQQLIQLTEAGMPVASGLRLIASDVRRGRLSRSIGAVADELEGGADLAEAFDRHRGAFPPLYAQLVEVGVRTGRLPGVLLNLGEHLGRVDRLRLALWRALAYPLVVLVLTMGLILMWSQWLAPQFSELYEDFGTELPSLTLGLLAAAKWAMPAAIVVAALAVGVPVAWWMMDRLGWAVLGRQRLLLRLPLVGPALSRSMLGRWCGMLHLGADAGLDLPGALRLAGDASPSLALRADADVMAEALERGEPLSGAGDGHQGGALRLEVVPASVPASIQLASEHADLPAMLENLAAMYTQHAELRLGALQAILAPVMLVVLALVLGLTVLAMFLPLVKLMSSLM